MESLKFDFPKKHAYLSVSGVMFWKQFVAYAVHIDWCYHIIHKHSCWSQHIFVLTSTCPFMLWRICTIEPSFFKTTLPSPQYDAKHGLLQGKFDSCFDGHTCRLWVPGIGFPGA